MHASSEKYFKSKYTTLDFFNLIKAICDFIKTLLLIFFHYFIFTFVLNRHLKRLQIGVKAKTLVLWVRVACDEIHISLYDCLKNIN